MSMYATEPKLENEGTPKPAATVPDKRIEALESKIATLSARLDQMQSALDAATRGHRKLAHNLDSVTAVLRSRK